ncbi:MAG: AbrB/MazE/SpoVT family DNA-binding domain-containing protein [Opitutales bacterium]
MKTRISSKGQVVIPKAYRQKLGWEPGTELMVEEEAGQVYLTKPHQEKRKTLPLSAAIGLLHRPGNKTLTVEDMEAAIDKEAKKYKF